VIHIIAFDTDVPINSHMWWRNYLPFRSTWVRHRFLIVSVF